MERQQLQTFTQRIDEKRGAKSSCRVQSEKFVAPTHPGYIIAANFQAAHIMHLQEELEKHYIAMGLQTGKKKLMKIPQMPSDRFFIIVDDSCGPPLLEGEFLIIKSHIVHYPVANSVQQVVAAFDSYIGLGHFETTEEYYQKNDNANHLAEKMGHTTQQIKTANSSISQTKSICLKEVSSLRERTKFNGGRLFVYRNRNDNQEYWAMVSHLQASYQNCSLITFVERIDEYNGLTRSTNSLDCFVLMSHYSLQKLSQYFLKLKGIAVFADQHQKVDLFAIRNILLLTSRKEMVFRFVQQFVSQQVEKVATTPANKAYQDKSQSAVGSAAQPKEHNQEGNVSQAKRPGIMLVGVSDLDKSQDKKSASIYKKALGKPQQKSYKFSQNSPIVAIPEVIQPELSEKVSQGNNPDYNAIQAHKISKIKRLKSSKSIIQIPQQADKAQQEQQQQNLDIKANQKNSIRPNTSLVNSHLRMGSDNYNKRSHQKAQPTHRRMNSDENAGLSPKICVISPKPSNIEDSVDSLTPKQKPQQALPNKPLISQEKSKQTTQYVPLSQRRPILAEQMSPKSRRKVIEDRQLLTSKANKQMKTVQKKVVKSSLVPPVMLVMSSISAFNQLQQGANSDIDAAGLSNISSIPLKQAGDVADRNKRFTFGLKEEAMQSIGQNQKRRQSLKSKSLSQVHRVFNRIKPRQSNETKNEIVDNNTADDPYQSNLIPNQISRSVNNPRAGKIYSQLRPKHPKKHISKLESELSSENEFLQDGDIMRSRSALPKTTEDRFRVNHNRNIQDLIDMSKFQKVIEKGMVVYRSKIPVQASEYSPTIVHDKPTATIKSKVKQPVVDKSIENPYELLSNKYAEKQKGLQRVRYEGDFMQQNVGVQCQPQFLTTTQRKPVFQPLFIANNIVSSTNYNAPSKKQTGPICEMLASKLSQSSGTQPKLIKSLQSPEIPSNNDTIMSEDHQFLQEVGTPERLVLYLVEKAQPYWMFEELKRMKSSKDSLISFKDQKQLAQQLPQTINIYDIVYVLPREVTASIEKMIKNQPNCYVVHISEGKVKIGTRRVDVRELKQLKEISDQLQLRQTGTKGMRIKTKLPQKTRQGKESPRSHHCCSICPRHS